MGLLREAEQRWVRRWTDILDWVQQQERRQNILLTAGFGAAKSLWGWDKLEAAQATPDMIALWNELAQQKFEPIDEDEGFWRGWAVIIERWDN